ncbi:hypothetical protein LDENG_00213450, partial [Lucifuga dentata]
QLSNTHHISCGVSLGSCLGPLLFNLYKLPLGNIIRQHNIHYYNYADDKQLYISVEPDDINVLNFLSPCLADINKWMATNCLKQKFSYSALKLNSFIS